MRMGGSSSVVRRRVPLVTHTHALFDTQSHCIPDNLVASLGHSRAWNCSYSEHVFGITSSFLEREYPLEQCPLRNPTPRIVAGRRSRGNSRLRLTARLNGE